MALPQQQVVGLSASPDAYIRQGWSVVAIPPNTKGPTHKGWNNREGCLTVGAQLPMEWGTGLCHAYSGTCALDIDDWEQSKAYLIERNINIENLFNDPMAVQIDSGNPGHGKLLFATPLGLALPSKRIMVAGKVIMELRCGTANGLTVQDVLPPSRHPSGTTYRWAGGGNWQQLPQLPDQLFDLWQSLIDEDTRRVIPNSNITPASWIEMRSATMSLDADCDRQTWIEVGMALHSAGSSTDHLDVAYELWNEWSQQSEAKYKPADMPVQWRSFKPDPAGIKVGTLFHHAKLAGWRRPAPDVSELFGKVKQQPAEMLKKVSASIPSPAIDLSLWPTVLADRAREVSQEVGCDPVVPLIAGLAAVCAAVDKRIRLRLTETWTVPPLLWMMTIGAPADKKTPGSKPMFVPLRKIEIEDRPRYEVEKHIWLGKEARFASQMKSYREFSGNADGELPNSMPPDVEQLPPEPQALRLLVNDATSQKVVHMAAGRPRGFLLLLDEMNHWLNKINDPRGGEDRGCWIQGYESATYVMDRVSAGSIYAENLAVAVYGNCQPAVFKHHMSAASNDGLVQRFIPVALNGDFTTMWQQSLPEFLSSAPAYEQMIRQVYALREQTFDCSPEALMEFRGFSEWYLRGRKLDTLLQASEIYMTAAGKMEGSCARLAALLHVIEHPHSQTVSGATMRQAVAIMRQFIVPSLRYSFMEIAGLKDELAKWIAEHIIQLSSVRPIVSLSDLRRAARRQVGDRPSWKADQDIRVIMDDLAEAGYVQLFEDHGRSTVWTINAGLATIFKEYRESIIDAKQSVINHFKEGSIKKLGRLPVRLANAIGFDA